MSHQLGNLPFRRGGGLASGDRPVRRDRLTLHHWLAIRVVRNSHTGGGIDQIPDLVEVESRRGVDRAPSGPIASGAPLAGSIMPPLAS